MDRRREIVDLNEAATRSIEKGHYSEAINILEQVKELVERHLGVKDTLRLSVLTNLGDAYRFSGEYLKAQTILQQVLTIERIRLPKDDLSLASILFAFAQCYFCQANYSDAIALLEECLTIRQKHPNNEVAAARTMTALGDCFKRQRKLSDAERLLRSSLEIMKVVLPEDHLEVANSQYTLAQCLALQGRQMESVKLLKNCVRIYRMLLNPLHPSVATAVGQLGYYLMEAGHLEESETCLREALHIQRGSLQVKHPHTALTLQWLGDYLMRRGKNVDGEKLLSEAVNIQAASLSLDHPNRIDTLILWSRCLLNIADYTRAQPAAVEALRIINVHSLPSDSRQKSNVMLLLRRLSAFQQPLIRAIPQAGVQNMRDEREHAFKSKEALVEHQGREHLDQSLLTLDKLHISDLPHPVWVGGTLELLHIGSGDGLSFCQTIGSEGGQLTAGSVNMTVPPGAVQSPTLFLIHSFIHNKYTPPVSASGDQVVSPVVFLGPHDVSFSKPINVRINSIADVTSPGWLLTLMRSESSLDETKQRWHGVVEYSTDTQELKSHIPFDANSWSFEVSKLSWWMWIARFIKNPTIPFRRKMGCVVLGRSLSHSSCKWSLSVHMFNSYEEIGQEIIKSHRAHETLPAVQLCPVTEFIVRKEGHVVITPQHGSEWSLCRRDVQLQCPTEYLWRKAFNHDHCFTFVIEANDSRPDSLEVPVRVEYIRQGQVESYETLQAVYKLLHTTRAIDLPRTSVPSNFPSPSLSDEEQESFYFCGTDGLHSSGSVSSPMAARDGASSQRSIVKQPADVHTVRQCVVSPSYSRAREHTPLLVRLPVGSEVPSTGCMFRYIHPTDQTVTETRGERIDSRTVQTITPAWPHADRVEMAMLSSDGQSRLAYLVHDFVDTPAADPESPHTSMKRDDDSTVAVASQGPNKEHDELDLQSIVSDVQLLEVGKAVRSHWHEIGIRLGVDMEELSDCRHRYPQDKNCIVHIFSLWKKQVSKPTTGILLEACRQAGVVGAAERALKDAQKQKSS